MPGRQGCCASPRVATPQRAHIDRTCAVVGARRSEPLDESVQQRAGTTKGQVHVDTRGWYVLVTSRSGKSVFARLGPYPTWELAERKARNSRLVHYRVESVLTSSARRQVAVRN